VAAQVKGARDQVALLDAQLKNAELLVSQGVNAAATLDEPRRQLEVAKNEQNVLEKQLLEAEQACKLDEASITAAKYRLALKEKGLKELLAERDRMDKEARTRVTQAKSEIEALREERRGADLRLQMSEVRATKAGLVTTLPFPTEKRHVGEGATVATISPSGTDLILKAYVKNSDRANIRLDQAAKIRFAAFPYQEYGAIEGKVLEISADVVKPDAGSGVEPGYEVAISLSTTEITSNRGEKKTIQLGYVANADIVVDERPVIFVLLSELKRLFDTRSSQ
jgi:HlyD family secretion protein